MTNPFKRTYTPSERYDSSAAQTFGDNLNICTNYFVYATNWEDETRYKYHNFAKIDNVDLVATSNHKFGFTDFNQCQAYFTGNYKIGDFTYYIERLIDGEWLKYTSSTDWYYIANYENPFYIVWHNINYFPVGTYRYIADWGNTGTQLYYSNEFQITQSTIGNQGTATGTIDGDGNINIDVNIDTGETVDNIKDYLGQEPEDTNGDIENSLNGIKDNLENELTDNQIIGAMQEAEQGFLDLLKEKEKDFKISWNDIHYGGAILIPKGEINFSQLCRENETLKQVRYYINVITSFAIAYGIIKYLYNLLLATLGIDNQYLYETPEETTTFTADTSTGQVTYRTRTASGNTIIRRQSMKDLETQRENEKWKNVRNSRQAQKYFKSRKGHMM